MRASSPRRKVADVEDVTGLGVGQHDPGRDHLHRVVDDARVVRQSPPAALPSVKVAAWLTVGTAARTMTLTDRLSMLTTSLVLLMFDDHEADRGICRERSGEVEATVRSCRAAVDDLEQWPKFDPSLENQT